MAHRTWIVGMLLCLNASSIAGDHTFTVRGDKTFLNGRAFPVKGLRCSNALISDDTTRELIDQLDTFAS